MQVETGTIANDDMADKEGKRIFGEIQMLLGDLQADGARSLQNELSKELIERFGSEGNDEEVKFDVDGPVKLNNGMATIMALKALQVALNFTSCLIS